MLTGRIEQLREFVVQNFLFGDDTKLQDDTSFIETGIIDSTGVLELVSFLENAYHIKIEDDELTPDNLDSLVNMDRYLDKKLACAE